MKVCKHYVASLNELELNVINQHLLAQLGQGLMYFKIRIAGVVCTAMIDSGASRDIIDANLAKRLNLSLKIVPEIAMHMADDTQVICRQVADKTVIKFTAVDKPPFKDIIDLSVLDLKGKFDLILGICRF